MDALESLRILGVIEACPFRDRLNPPGDERPALLAAYCRATLYLTDWAMRRPTQDPRTLRRDLSQLEEVEEVTNGPEGRPGMTAAQGVAC